MLAMRESRKAVYAHSYRMILNAQLNADAKTKSFKSMSHYAASTVYA